MSNLLVRTATRPGHTTRLSRNHEIPQTPRPVSRITVKHPDSSFISEIRAMWKYLTASSFLLAVTLICIASTGSRSCPHRRLALSSEEEECLNACKLVLEVPEDARVELLRSTSEGLSYASKRKVALELQNYILAISKGAAIADPTILDKLAQTKAYAPLFFETVVVAKAATDISGEFDYLEVTDHQALDDEDEIRYRAGKEDTVKRIKNKNRIINTLKHLSESPETRKTVRDETVKQLSVILSNREKELKDSRHDKYYDFEHRCCGMLKTAIFFLEKFPKTMQFPTCVKCNGRGYTRKFRHCYRKRRCKDCDETGISLAF